MDFEFTCPTSFNSFFGIEEESKSVITRIPEIEEWIKVSEIFINNSLEPMYELLCRHERINYEDSLAFYSLLLMIEKPLLPDVNRIFNQILSFFLCQEQILKQTDQHNQEELRQIAINNTIIVIAAECFGQRIR